MPRTLPQEEQHQHYQRQYFVHGIRHGGERLSAPDHFNLFSVKQPKIWAQKTLAHQCSDLGSSPIRVCLFVCLCQAPPLAPLALDNEQVFKEGFIIWGGQLTNMVVSVKEPMLMATSTLAGKGHITMSRNQVLACSMKPNFVKAFIQRGALRWTESAS